MKVEMTNDQFTQVMKNIEKLVSQEVLVGVPASGADRDDGPINNAQLLYLHNFGGTIQIPAHDRPIYRKVDKQGNLMNGGRFAKRAKSNFETTAHVEAYTVTIPPRKVLEPGIQKKKDQIAGKLANAAKAAIDGKNEQADNDMSAAGLIAQNGVRAEFGGDSLQPLSENTLKNRRSRGRTGDKPLLDTGELRNSITYVKRKKR